MTPCSPDAAGSAPGRDARPGAHGPLPDLLGLSLAEVRRLDHPVLGEVLDELRGRMARSGETLWGFDQGT